MSQPLQLHRPLLGDPATTPTETRTTTKMLCRPEGDYRSHLLALSAPRSSLAATTTHLHFNVPQRRDLAKDGTTPTTWRPAILVPHPATARRTDDRLFAFLAQRLLCPRGRNASRSQRGRALLEAPAAAGISRRWTAPQPVVLTNLLAPKGRWGCTSKPRRSASRLSTRTFDIFRAVSTRSWPSYNDKAPLWRSSGPARRPAEFR